VAYAAANGSRISRRGDADTALVLRDYAADESQEPFVEVVVSCPSDAGDEPWPASAQIRRSNSRICSLNLRSWAPRAATHARATSGIFGHSYP